MIFTDKQIKEIKKLFSKSKNIVIVTHSYPDGDAMGASLGLYNLLKKINFNISIITPTNYPEFLKWLPGDEFVIKFSKNPEQALECLNNAEIIFCIDFNALSRIDKLEEHLSKSDAVKIMIDHHPYPEKFVDYSFSSISVSSAAELVYEFIQKIAYSKHIDKDIATCLYTGIMADTGSFSFNSSNPQTFRIVAELLTHNINKDEITGRIYNNFSSDRMRLLGHCLNNMKVFPEYNTAFITINYEEKKKFNFKTGDSEGFVNYPLSIKGIVFSAFFIDKKDHVKISFRSKGKFEVNKFAMENFNGGGHINAAAGKSELSMEETINKFIDLLPKYKDELF